MSEHTYGFLSPFFFLLITVEILRSLVHMCVYQIAISHVRSPHATHRSEKNAAAPTVISRGRTFFFDK